MPTQRFEGPDLDTALARARAKVGGGARVLSAERVRSGGVGGFFSKERVEIEVEVGSDDAPPRNADDQPRRPPPPPPPKSLLDLADMVSRAEDQDSHQIIRPDRVEAMAHMGVHGDDRPFGPPPETATPPTVSTETSTFAEILDRITAQTVAPAAVTEGRRAATRPAAPPVAAEPDPDAVAPTADPTPTEPAAAVEVPTQPSETLPAPPVPSRSPVRLISAPAIAPRALPPLPAPVSEPGPLTRLGLPPELEPYGPDLRVALVDQLARLPRSPALPCSRGTVVAVIGPRGAAHHVARTVCLRVGADPATLATLAARRRRATDPELTTVEEVTDHRRAWRRRPLPTVVVIDAPLGRPSSWVADVLTALEPTVVWGVVEASRKVEDIAAWSDDLGGLDALCLTGLDDTVSPASPLRIGLPVALLEGHPATPDRWADLLLSRLAS